MDDALEAEVRRLWGGEGSTQRPDYDDVVRESVRIVSAAGVVARDQVRRLDALTLPLGQVDTYAGRSNPEVAAARFFDQVRSDYRRVSPRLGLRQVEQWRVSDDGVVALNNARIGNESVGVLAVGELLDLSRSPRFLKDWAHPGDADMKAFVSTFGDVLGPIVQSAIAVNNRLPVWGPDLESSVGQRWTLTFLEAGSRILRNAGRPGHRRRARLERAFGSSSVS